jgi:hypothetical protein
MSIVETKPNKRMLVAPMIWAISDVLNAYPSWFGSTWLQALDDTDLAEMFEQAAANRRIAQPRALIASLLFAQMRNHFPDQVRPLKTERRRRPADQPAQRMAAA